MQSPLRQCRRISRWISSMKTSTCWWSISPKEWSFTQPPATRTGHWSTPCCGTARAVFPALAVRFGPASSTALIRTPAACWWWPKTMPRTSASRSRWRSTVWNEPTIPLFTAALHRTKALWKRTLAAARRIAKKWRFTRPVSLTPSMPTRAIGYWSALVSLPCWSAA